MYITIIITLIIKAFKCKGGGWGEGRGKERVGEEANTFHIFYSPFTPFIMAISFFLYVF